MESANKQKQNKYTNSFDCALSTKARTEASAAKDESFGNTVHQLIQLTKGDIRMSYFLVLIWMVLSTKLSLISYPTWLR